MLRRKLILIDLTAYIYLKRKQTLQNQVSDSCTFCFAKFHFYLIVYFQYPKVPTHKCLVLGQKYHSSAQITFHIWSAAVNSKDSYWHYMCMLCFPHIILSCYRCRKMRTFVLWSEMCLLHKVLIGEILKPVISNCSVKKSALVSLSSPQTPHGLLWV